jgi:hypothetical protein
MKKSSKLEKNQQNRHNRQNSAFPGTENDQKLRKNNQKEEK